MKQWRCKVCGYISVGPEPPEACPVCGVGPEQFEAIEDEPAPAVAGDDHRRLQGILFQVPCGLFVVSAARDGRPNGMINNTVFWITDAPLQILVGMDKRHLTSEYVAASGSLAVNILTPDRTDLVKRFGYQSGREIDKFAGIAWHPGVTGSPILEEASGYLECRVRAEKTMDAGTHWVFLAEVVAGELAEKSPIMTYQEYRDWKKERR